MKTLKELFEIYRPKAKGEQDFVDKHVVIKNKDRNGNDDDVFNGKTKPVNRKKNRQGYDVGDDEKVYEELVAAYAEKYDMTIEEVESIIEELIAEEVEELDELSKALLRRTGGRMLRKGLGDGPRAKQHMKSANLASAKLYPDQHKNSLIKARVNATNEEVEDLDELEELDEADRGAPYRTAANKAKREGDMIGYHKNMERFHDHKEQVASSNYGMRSSIAKKHAAEASKHRSAWKSGATNEELEDLDEGLGTWSHEKLKSFANVPHGSYSPKEISNEIQRRKRNGEYNANYQTEEVEDLDEVSYDTLGGYIKKTKGNPKRKAGLNRAIDKQLGASGQKIWADGRKNVAYDAFKKVRNEEVEDLDEISKPALGRYIKAASHDVATRASATARYAEKEDQARKEGDWDAARKNSKIADKAFNKGWKRRQHIAKAVDRLTKEDVINRAIEKYIVSEADLPTPTERLLAKLDGLSESHIDTLVTIFEGLNEDNQMKMLYTAESHEGILSLLDFAIQNKGA